ncbi:MAG TPA: carbonic anhydrase [Methyloceanibacter sp.]|jgi:carbonic anhydrase|nr:carbonic anhydrase [Methyloceanibacter sp.]
MTGGAALLAASVLPFAFARADQPVSSGPAPNAIPPAEALDRLMHGNVRYVAGDPAEKDFSAGRAARVTAQYPIAAILSCSDSRVAPELAFDQGPGDVFVVRVAGNFVNPDGLASLEYAVHFLGVPLLMVLGHSNCGAVGAAIEVVTGRAELPGHLPELVKAIEPAVIAAHARHPGDLLAAAIEENVRLTVMRLIDDAPVLSDALATRKIAVSGGVYDLATGKVSLI